MRRTPQDRARRVRIADAAAGIAPAATPWMPDGTRHTGSLYWLLPAELAAAWRPLRVPAARTTRAAEVACSEGIGEQP